MATVSQVRVCLPVRVHHLAREAFGPASRGCDANFYQPVPGGDSSLNGMDGRPLKRPVQ